MKWTEVLAELAADIDQLKSAGFAEAPQTPWVAPEVEGDMTAAERAEAIALLARIRAVETEVACERGAVGGELRGLGSRRSATRAYARS